MKLVGRVRERVRHTERVDGRKQGNGHCGCRDAWGLVVHIDDWGKLRKEVVDGDVDIGRAWGDYKLHGDVGSNKTFHPHNFLQPARMRTGDEGNGTGEQSGRRGASEWPGIRVEERSQEANLRMIQLDH